MSFIRQREARHGRFHYNINDTYVGRSLRLYGEWAESEVHAFTQIVRAGDVVLEAGANIGTHTVPLSRLAGATGCVHAFEPQGLAHQLLCANLVTNGCTNTRSYQVALGATGGELCLPDVPPDAMNNFGGIGALAASESTVLVPMQTVDMLNLPRLDFLKVDIEGYELELLKGAAQTLARCRPIAFVESANPYTGDCSAALRDHFVALGYRCWHYITPLFNARNYDAYPFDEFKGLWSFDLLCVPGEAGEVTGLYDAQTHPAFCDLPEQWRDARFLRAPGTAARGGPVPA